MEIPPSFRTSWIAPNERHFLMALTDEIRGLKDRVLADLNSAHDYFTDTKIAWDIVREAIVSGRAFTIRNTTTDTVTTQGDLADRSRGYVSRQLAEATFQQFISIFENYFFDLPRLWLIAYPKSLIGKQIEFKIVLDSPDKDAITLLVVNERAQRDPLRASYGLVRLPGR
jgi:hypothetical protein